MVKDHKGVTAITKHTQTITIKYLTRRNQMAMSQAKLAKKRASKNLKRKGKKYNPHKQQEMLNVSGTSQRLEQLTANKSLHADTTTLVL